MRVLPHLMSSHEINDFFPVVKLDEGENQLAHELEQGITRPSDELADPGPRGRIYFVPAMSIYKIRMNEYCDDRWTHPRPGYLLVGGPCLLVDVYV